MAGTRGGTLEERLIPLNAILDLATPNGVSRSVLADAGYEVSGLEIPCITDEGIVVVDVVLAHPRTGHLIACESKSGGNIEADQARRYKVLEAQTVVRGAFVTLRERVQPKVEILYAARAESADRVTYGLNQVGIPAAVLAVHADRITLENPQAAGAELLELFASPVPLSGPPARHIPFDQDSGPAEVQPHVRAALISMLRRRVQMMSIGTLAEQAVSHYPLYGTKAQGRLRRLVGDAARTVAADAPDTFEYHPPAGPMTASLGCFEHRRTTTHEGERRATKGSREHDSAGARHSKYLASSIFSLSSKRRIIQAETPHQMMKMRQGGRHDDMGRPV